VRGRNSDNTLLHSVIGWEPSIPLRQGLAVTYKWIASQVTKPVAKRELVSTR
jgi:nucleoside-diphosphate-sugar epimerase